MIVTVLALVAEWEQITAARYQNLKEGLAIRVEALSE